MAEIQNIDICDGKIDIKLSINKEEYRLLKHQMADLIILPCGKDSLVYSLTTGKLGNSNRIMLPKKVLNQFKIGILDKKVPSNIFVMDGDAYLLIKIKKSDMGIPKFSEELHESHDRH